MTSLLLMLLLQDVVKVTPPGGSTVKIEIQEKSLQCKKCFSFSDSFIHSFIHCQTHPGGKNHIRSGGLNTV